MTPRRTLHDPLQAVDKPTWLVVRDRHRFAQAAAALAAGADLRGILEGARTEWIAAGWACTEFGRACAVFFAERGAERLQIAIERRHPDDPGPMHCDPKPV